MTQKQKATFFYAVSTLAVILCPEYTYCVYPITLKNFTTAYEVSFLLVIFKHAIKNSWHLSTTTLPVQVLWLGSELFSFLKFFSQSNFLRTHRIVQYFGGIQAETFSSTLSKEENWNILYEKMSLNRYQLFILWEKNPAMWITPHYSLLLPFISLAASVTEW